MCLFIYTKVSEREKENESGEGERESKVFHLLFIPPNGHRGQLGPCQHVAAGSKCLIHPVLPPQVYLQGAASEATLILGFVVPGISFVFCAETLPLPETFCHSTFCTAKPGKGPMLFSPCLQSPGERGAGKAAQSCLCSSPRGF